MLITKVSGFTGRTHTLEIDITPEQLEMLDNPNRPAIQTFLSHLSADDREFLMTGVTAEEWEAAFPE